MKIVFKRAKNGYVVRYKYDHDDEIHTLVSQENEEDEHSAFISFLWLLISELGPSDSKYSEKRMFVGCKPGNSYEGDLDDEYFNSLLELYGSVKSSMAHALVYRKKNKLDMPKINEWDADDYNEICKEANRLTSLEKES